MHDELDALSVFYHLRLQEIEAEFDKHVSLRDISIHQLDLDNEGIVYIYNYWKLKRRVSHIEIYVICS